MPPREKPPGLFPVLEANKLLVLLVVVAGGAPAGVVDPNIKLGLAGVAWVEGTPVEGPPAGGKREDDGFGAVPNKPPEGATLGEAAAWGVPVEGGWPNSPRGAAAPAAAVGVLFEDAPNRPPDGAGEPAAPPAGVDEAPPKRPPPVAGLAAPENMPDDVFAPAPPNSDGPDDDGAAVEGLLVPAPPKRGVVAGLAPAVPNSPPPVDGVVAAPGVDDPNEKEGAPDDAAPPNKPAEAGADVVGAWPVAALELGAPKVNDMLTME